MNELFFPLSHNLNELRVDRLSQFWGYWAIDANALRNTLSMISRVDLAEHVEANADLELSTGGKDFETIDDRVAVVRVNGPMSKRGSSLNRSGGTVRARHQLRAAVNDADIESILMVFETPGGTVSGTKELADDIRRAGEAKRVVAYGEDLVASAGYWAASQASEFYANATAMVGSIGTYMSVADSSEAHERAGVKVHVISTGRHKGAGTPGTEITDEHLASMQESVDSLNKIFLEAVATGRGLTESQVKQVADGRTFVASEAVDLGLLDGVKSFDEVVSSLLNPEGGDLMQDHITLPTTSNDKIEAVETNEAPTAEVLETVEPSIDASIEEQVEAIESVDAEADDVREELASFVEAFGNKGAEYFLANMSFEDAAAEFIQEQGETIARLEARVKVLETSERDPLSSGNLPEESDEAPGFAANIRL